MISSSSQENENTIPPSSLCFLYLACDPRRQQDNWNGLCSGQEKCQTGELTVSANYDVFMCLQGVYIFFSEVLNSWTVLAYCEAKITVCCIVFGNELKPSVAVKRSYAINFLRSHWLASWHASTKTVTCPRPGNMTLTRFSGIKKAIYIIWIMLRLIFHIDFVTGPTRWDPFAKLY